jgi:xanthine dehydrogenase YagS FAD-binding subunit
MKPFNFSRATDTKNAVQTVAGNKEAKFIAGGTNLIDLMKEGVENPSALIDISRLNLSQIKEAKGGGVSIGALARNTDTANHPLIRQNYPLLSQAILAGASQQIRNMATNGGNLLQRTRCNYFYDVAMPCNKREPGTGCGALEGMNRNHAIFGWSDKCVATHPSDMCVALAALDAVVKVSGANGKERSIPFLDFHRLPGDAPEKDNNLAHGELITAIELPPMKTGFASSYYLKVRDRASYAFALISVAAVLHLKGGRTSAASSIVLGGVAHKPWRATAAEEVLNGGRAVNDELFKQAAVAAVKDARALMHNKFKIELAQRAIVRALQRASRGAV